MYEMYLFVKDRSLTSELHSPAPVMASIYLIEVTMSKTLYLYQFPEHCSGL